MLRKDVQNWRKRELLMEYKILLPTNHLSMSWNFSIFTRSWLEKMKAPSTSKTLGKKVTEFYNQVAPQSNLINLRTDRGESFCLRSKARSCENILNQKESPSNICSDLAWRWTELQPYLPPELSDAETSIRIGLEMKEWQYRQDSANCSEK